MARLVSGAGASGRVPGLVRPGLRALEPYAVEDARGMVKLDAMENPYGWPDDMRAGWLAELAEVDVNRYPDPSAADLKVRLKATEGIAGDQDLVLGNGSDELIQILVTALGGPGAGVLSVSPGFVMYRRSCTAAGVAFEEVPLAGDDFGLDQAAMLEAVRRHDPSLIFLAYPNNPTGNLFDAGVIESVARAARGLLVIDEAYAPFAGESWLERSRGLDNVVVMRTLSKLGLAGLRLGYLVGAPEWTRELEKLRLPYNINVLTQKSALFALGRRQILEEQARSICGERDALYRALAGVGALKVWPSRANFLLFRTETAGAAAVYEGLKARKVLIKNLHGSSPALKNCLRVTVGTPADNAAFLSALEDTLRDAA